jgi:hypothetical protein
MFRLFIEVLNDLAAITANSIKLAMPDVEPIFYCSGEHNYWADLYARAHGIRVIDASDETLPQQFEGFLFIIPSGCIVLKDFRPHMPPVEFLGNYATAVSRKFMYLSETHYETSYRELRVDVSDNKCYRVRAINTAAKKDRKLLMPIRFRFGLDVIVRDGFDAVQLVDNQLHALQADVLDFGDEAATKDVQLETCWASPFELWGDHAEVLKEYLPPETYKTIKRNAERTEEVIPLRDSIGWETPPTEYM